MQQVLLRGRVRERAAIVALVAGAAAGNGGGLLLAGERGSGRSALLRFAAGEAAGLTVLATAGAAAEAGLPFAGLQRLLQPVLGAAPALPEHQARMLLRAVRDGDCPAGRLPLCLAVPALLREVARERALLLLVDDAHLLDPASWAVLEFAARRLDGQPIALLAAVDDAPDTEGVPGVPLLRLEPLDQHDSARLLTDRRPELSADVAPALAATAAGNPQALVELAAALSPEQCRGDVPPPATLPPDGALRRAYRARLARLDPDARWLLLLAAADPDLDVRELAAAADASGTDVAALEPAEAANLIRVGDRHLTFPQPLLRSVTYHEASLARRRAAHLLLARIVGTGTLRDLLHRAAATSGPDPALADALRRAAEGAAHAAAATALERAAELTAEPADAAGHLVAAARHAWLGGQPSRARTLLRRAAHRPAPPAVRARAQLLTGEIELRGGAVTRSRHTLLAAATALAGPERHLSVGAFILAGEAACLTGDHLGYAELARQALALRRDHPPLPVALMFDHFTGVAALFRGDFPAALAPLRRVLDAAPGLGDAVALVRAGSAGILVGAAARAHQLALDAVAIARAGGDTIVVPQALEIAAVACLATGRHDEGRDAALEGVRLARMTGQSTLADNHLGLLAVLAAIVGDRPTCIARVRQLRIQPAGANLGQARAFAEWALALLDLVEGRPGPALARLTRILDTGGGHGNRVIQIPALVHLAEAAAQVQATGVPTEAFAAFDGWAASTGNPTWLALSARCRALRSHRDSDEHFREALRLHEAGDSEFARAHTALLFGQDLRRRRRPRAAREHLRGALETFQRLDAARWAARAAAELRAAGEQVAPPTRPATTAALTPQQEQIARLVADGATNREVATRLYLSPRTIDHHLRNIFSRLGVRSRTELARLMG
ncbi:AAA ATPase domain-containing protein [Micromonospora pattaloongensis]|uniref:AAA ATPase domain-containing protein n=1 Tax=Micromonospora pattaloongensis TaxID=405436 RepID=A0A1H3QS71_9ACTN|nr:LuxR C-terminal-related transcriptional regulator [Micromonospora pattaloongensis]SDZ15911.1 AAA ATPase domain-containing protein [Micromonospora pattaloongensis]